MTKKSILITFGCSWTFGIGAGYQEGLEQDYYEKNIRYDSDLNWKHSWRKIVSEHFDVRNLNFSVGGSSNQRQFKEARDFFVSDHWADIQKLYNNIIILWGITTTTRNYMYCRDVQLYRDLYLNPEALKDKNLLEKFFQFKQYEDMLSMSITKWSYDYDVEIKNLEQDILFFNNYLSHFTNVKNFWFDTFQSHTYNKKIDNLIDQEKKDRDLLSYLLKRYIKEHNIQDCKISRYEIFDHAVEYGILNPYSFHPQKKSYKQIAEYFIKKLTPYF